MQVNLMQGPVAALSGLKPATVTGGSAGADPQFMVMNENT
jgi:hypothetical protein